MACLQATCPKCGKIEFGNDRYKIRYCSVCKTENIVEHDEFGRVQYPILEKDSA